MNISNMKVSDIRPYEKNPRLNEGAVDAVAAALSRRKRKPKIRLIENLWFTSNA